MTGASELRFICKDSRFGNVENEAIGSSLKGAGSDRSCEGRK